MTLALEQILNGVQFGVMLFLLAAGLTLIFGIMGVINLAHGSLYMIGAYAAALAVGDDRIVPAGASRSRWWPRPSPGMLDRVRGAFAGSTRATTATGARDLRPDPVPQRRR